MKIKISCEAADTMPIGDMVDFQGGLKSISQINLTKLKAAIVKYGFSAPVFIWESPGGPRVLDGHQRMRAVRELEAAGWEIPPLPVARIFAKDEKEAKEKLLHIASQYGSVSQQGLFDFASSADISLPELDIRLPSGEVSIARLGNPMETSGDDKVPGADQEVEIGDIWEVGRHRVMCGDATDRGVVKALSGAVTVDLYLTDPPYNVSYIGKTKDALTIDNDGMSDEKFYLFLTALFRGAAGVMKPGAAFYIFHADSKGLVNRSASAAAGLDIRQVLVWEKNVMVMGRQDYQWIHEPILYGWKPGAPHHWFGGRNKSTVIKVDRPARSAEHPTMKPIALLEQLITNSTEDGGVVYDSCLGSGSTLIACEKTGRVCLGVEIDPCYCSVVIERFRGWMKVNNKKAVVRKIRCKKNGE